MLLEAYLYAKLQTKEKSGGRGDKYHWPRERLNITREKSGHWLCETNHLSMAVTAKEERAFPFFKNITTVIFIMGLDPTNLPLQTHAL